MPKSRREKPIYQRGDFKLYPREGRSLEIVWYDRERRRERSASTGTDDLEEAKLALDRQYLRATGTRICPTCHRPFDPTDSPRLIDAIGDYLLLSEEKAGVKSARTRLALAVEYITQNDLDVRANNIDEAWVNGFRKWLAAKPVVSPKGNHTRPRSLGHVEQCVMQLAAAINATPGQSASFRPEKLKDVAVSPSLRVDVHMMARMFRFAMEIPERKNLLNFLRAAVATWARPDAIYDIDSAQWNAAARVLDLNPKGRRQTKKYRPKLPIAKQFAPVLDELDGQLIPVTTVRASWDKMRIKCGLPGGGQAGEKLIRRSMATMARKRIGEANWRQGEMMLGHAKASVSDIYAIPDPANLGLALAATESIIDEIEALAPGAFYRTVTANGRLLSAIKGGKNG